MPSPRGVVATCAGGSTRIERGLTVPGYGDPMAGIASKLTQLARSPQGRKLMNEAQRLAKDPKTRAKIDDARAKLMGGRGGGGRPPAA